MLPSQIPGGLVLTSATKFTFSPSNSIPPGDTGLCNFFFLKYIFTNLLKPQLQYHLFGNRFLQSKQFTASHNLPYFLFSIYSVQFRSVTQWCLTLCDPMNCSTGVPVHHQLLDVLKLMSIELVMPSSHLILCRPLLLLPPIPPSIRVFSNESTLCMRWPKYWSFSFNISPSNEHPGLISFRMD